ncbi:MAG: hypothetical protein JXR22_11010 [Prolixibacteraceae bacterium]|nr:hypothetical protein [Prolixibacteraceae bacterium]
MKGILTITLFFAALSLMAQSKDEIIKRGIEVRRYYEKELDEGDTEFFIFKEEYFNVQGELVEIKEYKNKGKEVSLWFKYKYDNQMQVIEELELDEKGLQKERIEYKYKDGLRIEKIYYDNKNRMRQIRKYEYGYR